MLLVAVANGHIDAMNTLIAHGVALDVQDKKYTLLCSAIIIILYILGQVTLHCTKPLLHYILLKKI